MTRMEQLLMWLGISGLMCLQANCRTPSPTTADSKKQTMAAHHRSRSQAEATRQASHRTASRTAPTTKSVAGNEGKTCRVSSDCQKPLECVNHFCLDITGKSPQCQWSLHCLRKIKKSNHPDADRETAAKQYEELKRMPLRSDCMDFAQSTIVKTQKPWVWKPLCGKPPIKGIVKTGGPNPFKILHYKIAGGLVPPDDPWHQEMMGPGHYRDTCRAQVKFQVTRPYQGRIVAQFYEEYECRRVQKKVNGRMVKTDQCKTRPYARTDAVYYVFLEKPGTVHNLTFYVETPPKVCKSRTRHFYPTGCLCLGLSPSKFELKPEEDPFLHPMELKATRTANPYRAR